MSNDEPTIRVIYEQFIPKEYFLDRKGLFAVTRDWHREHGTLTLRRWISLFWMEHIGWRLRRVFGR